VKRRDLLGTVGTVGALALAGCGVRESSAPDRTEFDVPDRTESTTPTNTPTQETTTDDPGEESDDAFDRLDRDADPVESFAVGDRESVPFPKNNNPHDVRVYNDADRMRSMTLSLRREGETVLERTIAVPGGRRVDATLNEPAAYRLAIALDGEDGVTGTPVEVERSWFDCNISVTATVVGPDGEVETSTWSTLVGCPGPEVVDATMEQSGGSCGDADRASVRFADEQVRVSGTHRTPTPCHGLTLSSSGLRDPFSGDDALVVTVETADRQGGCVECVGTVPYEATVDLEHAYPSTVRVVHAGPAGERVVAERGQ